MIRVPLSGIEIDLALRSRSGFRVGLPGVAPTWVMMRLVHQSDREGTELCAVFPPAEARQLAAELVRLADEIEPE